MRGRGREEEGEGGRGKEGGGRREEEGLSHLPTALQYSLLVLRMAHMSHGLGVCDDGIDVPVQLRADGVALAGAELALDLHDVSSQPTTITTAHTCHHRLFLHTAHHLIQRFYQAAEESVLCPLGVRLRQVIRVMSEF